jgi:hypothetical protein
MDSEPNTKPLTIWAIAQVPPALARAWLQHMRDFDVAHPGCHFQIMADAPHLSMQEIVEMLKISPDLTVKQIVERRT